jgi:uncharacterized protein YwqG
MLEKNKVQVAPGIKLSPELSEYWPEIEKTRQAFIKIKATPSEGLTPARSSFGHLPLIPKDFPYPVDKQGKPMFMLAQINFREVPKLERFPESGYLQIYIMRGDDLYGLDMDEPLKQVGFKVLFFEEHQLKDPRTDFSFLDGLELEFLPLDKPHALTFTQDLCYIGDEDLWSYDDISFLDELKKRHEKKGYEPEAEIAESFPQNGHRLGGYAHFTQTDPRPDIPETSDYMLLLQIDSDADILWGDAGIGNFFIHPDALARKDFSKVMYNWDCS